MTSDHLIKVFQMISKELPNCPICHKPLSYKNKEIYKTLGNDYYKKNICFDQITVTCECGWISEIAMPDKLFYNPEIFAQNGIVKYGEILTNQELAANIVFFSPRVYSHPMNWKLNEELINEIVKAIISNGIKGEIENGNQTKNRLPWL